MKNLSFKYSLPAKEWGLGELNPKSFIHKSEVHIDISCIVNGEEALQIAELFQKFINKSKKK